MLIRVTTRHSSDFDILTANPDPAQSPYAKFCKDYGRKVRAFYDELGIRSAIWTTPEAHPPRYLESLKPIEYLLEVDEARVAAYVNEDTWSPYIDERLPAFEYSRTRVNYGTMSILVIAPLELAEVKEFRRYRRINGPDKYELVERYAWPPNCRL